MSRRTRVFAGILLVYAIGVGLLMYRLLADIDPRYRESAEESLVETGYLMASLIEQRASSGAIDTAWLAPLFRELYARRFTADIFGVRKESVELRATVVDAHGTVLFDSLGRHQLEHQLAGQISAARQVERALAIDVVVRRPPGGERERGGALEVGLAGKEREQFAALGLIHGVLRAILPAGAPRTRATLAR